jgi:hypothetical protein
MGPTAAAAEVDIREILSLFDDELPEPPSADEEDYR